MGSEFFDLKHFKEIEDFLTFSDENSDFSNHIALLDQQITFVVENIIHLFKIQPFNHEKIINLVIKLYTNLKNQYLFKKILLFLSFEESPSLIYFLLKKKFYNNEEIKENFNYISIKNYEIIYKFYFPFIFNIKNDISLFISEFIIQEFTNQCNLFLTENLQIEQLLNFLFLNNYEKLLEFIEFGWLKNSINYYIKFDDYNEFIKNFFFLNINLNISIIPTFFEPFLKKKQYSLIELASCYGSLKIFNFLINKNIIISEKVPLYSLKSGNLELIRYFNIKKYKKLNFKIFKK